MPVVSVLLWATLLTLGWRAAHAKDYVPATPRVQLSFKGKSSRRGGGGGARGGWEVTPAALYGATVLWASPCWEIPLGSASLWGSCAVLPPQHMAGCPPPSGGAPWLGGGSPSVEHGGWRGQTAA